MPARTDRISRHKVLLSRRSVEACRHLQHFAIKAEDEFAVGAAQSTRDFGQGLEHRLQIGRRIADDLEQLGGCRLLFSRLRKFAGKSADLPFQGGKG